MNRREFGKLSGSLCLIPFLGSGSEPNVKREYLVETHGVWRGKFFIRRTEDGLSEDVGPYKSDNDTNFSIKLYSESKPVIMDTVSGNFNIESICLI